MSKPKKWGLSLLTVFVSLVVLGSFVDDPEPRNEAAEREAIMHRLIAEAEQKMLLTGDQKTVAISGIEGYPEVSSASIGQSENHLYLVVVVKPNTSLRVAKNMGDNFVRMVKTFGPDTSPGKVIGSGTYNYHIKVKVDTPTIKTIASGLKENDDTGIVWE